MIHQVLKNWAYLFYPKNVCSWTEKDKYVESEEYKRLRLIMESFDSKENKKFRKVLTNEFQKDPTLKDFQDLTRLDYLEDRCLTFLFTLIEEGELKSISLYVSVLIPYYVIQTITHTSQILLTPEQIEDIEKNNSEARKIDDLVLEIERIVENKLLYQKFPKELMNEVIEDITFQDSHLSDFTMFAAFFNNDFIH